MAAHNQVVSMRPAARAFRIGYELVALITALAYVKRAQVLPLGANLISAMSRFEDAPQ